MHVFKLLRREVPGGLAEVGRATPWVGGPDARAVAVETSGALLVGMPSGDGLQVDAFDLATGAALGGSLIAHEGSEGRVSADPFGTGTIVFTVASPSGMPDHIVVRHDPVTRDTTEQAVGTGSARVCGSHAVVVAPAGAPLDCGASLPTASFFGPDEWVPTGDAPLPVPSTVHALFGGLQMARQGTGAGGRTAGLTTPAGMLIQGRQSFNGDAARFIFSSASPVPFAAPAAFEAVGGLFTGSDESEYGRGACPLVDGGEVRGQWVDLVVHGPPLRLDYYGTSGIGGARVWSLLGCSHADPEDAAVFEVLDRRAVEDGAAREWGISRPGLYRCYRLVVEESHEGSASLTWGSLWLGRWPVVHPCPSAPGGSGAILVSVSGALLIAPGSQAHEVCAGVVEAPQQGSAESSGMPLVALLAAPLNPSGQASLHVYDASNRARIVVGGGAVFAAGQARIVVCGTGAVAGSAYVADASGVSRVSLATGLNLQPKAAFPALTRRGLFDRTVIAGGLALVAYAERGRVLGLPLGGGCSVLETDVAGGSQLDADAMFPHAADEATLVSLSPSAGDTVVHAGTLSGASGL
jgi:hypothetical protein